MNTKLVLLAFVAILAMANAAVPAACKGDKWSYNSSSNWEYKGSKINTIYDNAELEKFDGSSRFQQCCTACVETDKCKYWSLSASNKGFGCALYKSSADKIKWGGCSAPNSCVHRAGRV